MVLRLLIFYETLDDRLSIVLDPVLLHLVLEGGRQEGLPLRVLAADLGSGHLAVLVLSEQLFQLGDFVFILFQEGVLRVFVHSRFVLNVFRTA